MIRLSPTPGTGNAVPMNRQLENGTMLSIQDKMARFRNRKINHMVHTVARKCHDADFRCGLPSHLHHDYAYDPEIRAIVAKLYDDPAIPKIQIPARAMKLYVDGVPT
jgi:hypothetical protein